MTTSTLPPHAAPIPLGSGFQIDEWTFIRLGDELAVFRAGTRFPNIRGDVENPASEAARLLR